jgi:hypothetical protein
MGFHCYDKPSFVIDVTILLSVVVMEHDENGVN